MPLQRLRKFLDDRNVRYATVSHSPAYTAQEIAAAAHIPGKEVAKTVMVKLDDRMIMVAIPASHKVNLERLAERAGAKRAELATEEEFKAYFPDTEVGAMPPFGNLWNLSVYVCASLAEDKQIAFAAGSHSEVMILRFEDLRRIVEPRIVDCSDRR